MASCTNPLPISDPSCPAKNSEKSRLARASRKLGPRSGTAARIVFSGVVIASDDQTLTVAASSDRRGAGRATYRHYTLAPPINLIAAAPPFSAILRFVEQVSLRITEAQPRDVGRGF